MAKLVHLEFKVIPKKILQKIKFHRPFTQFSRRFRRKVFFTNVDTPGLVLMKRIDTNTIIFCRKATISMYNTAKKPYQFWEVNLGIKVEFAFIPLSKKELDDGFIELRYILHRTPHNDLFDTVSTFVESGMPVPESLLPFEDFNVRSTKSNKGIFTKYLFKAGVYFILEIRPNAPGEIVYIGQSSSGIGKRVRSHFCKPKIDEYKCYRVSYSKTKDIYQYKLCVVEIPVLRYKSQEEINKTILDLEKALIQQFNPRDNRMFKQLEGVEKIPYYEPEKKDYF